MKARYDEKCYDENYYRVLLESAHNGFENAKAFLEAVGNSEAAIKNVDIQSMIESTRKHLEQLERDADQLWDNFKRVLRAD
jgi:hypothetical protein